MATTSKVPVDVYISFAAQDKDLAEQVARELEGRGMSVFVDSPDRLVPAGIWENQIWDAIAESKAMILINPNIPENAWQGIELGAATAWGKPLFCVTSSDYTREIPTSLLRDSATFTESNLGALTEALIRSGNPLTDEETALLVDSYKKLGTPVDVLATEPSQLEKLKRTFAVKSTRSISGEQLLAKLLRLRKQGRLKAKP